ncbi:MAG: STAS domain-containing protein [Nocardioidaceae bacterium]
MAESVQPPTPRITELVIRGPIEPADIPVLCARARDQLEADGADLVVCDVAALVDPDATAVDAVARLQLTARRVGCQVRLRNVSCAMRDLLSFSGLGEVVRLVADSRAEPRGELEQREQSVGVQERVDPDHPPRGYLDDLQ